MSKIAKKKFKITDMHCSVCVVVIDNDLENLAGIKSSKTSYARGETEVEFESDKVTNQQILETIKKSGYSAAPLDS